MNPTEKFINSLAKVNIVDKIPNEIKSRVLELMPKAEEMASSLNKYHGRFVLVRS